MTIPTTDIHDTAHSWISFATDLPPGQIVPANDNKPRPSGTHFTVYIAPTLGNLAIMDEQGYREGAYLTRAHREALVSLQARGPDALELMSAVEASKDLRTVRKLFKAAQLVLIECRQIRDLTAPKGGSKLVEPRAQMDVLIRYASTLAETVATINAIEYDVEVGPEVLNDSVLASDSP